MKKVIFSALLTLIALPASALPPLEDNERIQREMTSGEVAYQISKHCPTINARLFRANGRLNRLKDYARGLGYSDRDIKALGKNPAAKAKLNALRDAYLAQHGVTNGDADSYCRLGYTEIQKKSLTGWLLRAN